ncbi:MAG: redox-regulated ATPase YchF [Deltaproteobacteria bacterium]|nr:redox-regulated ATPase YchF [Deltaproteobacteria bacterium]MBW2018498.1 redox-regulated ATPase YchF [Deltaproteobacteria bacterium]MBW2073233.1 redox-regulated ATPase YchF [Deltaproteobacteria bacterium]RLB83288.1 MAG: redox-regulated ATPase YchF [Deltaproteobacteria bacterium]
MRLGIIGLPGSGKSTIFKALTRSRSEEGAHQGHRIATVRVPDPRVDRLTMVVKPKKTVYAQLEYLLPYGQKGYRHDTKVDESFWNEVRSCDALIHVVRNFHQPGGEAPHLRDDFLKLETDMIFADLVVVEKRLERLDLDKKRGKEISDEERRLLEACHKMLEAQRPLRDDPELAAAHLLKGYALLSAKPVLVLFNNDDEDESPPPWEAPPELYNLLVVRGKLEMELAELPAEEAAEFLSAYHIESSAMDRVIQHSCRTLGLIAFFTMVHDEIRSWMIPEGTTALDAAGFIHSDMKKGFIRAEVVAYDDLMATGTYQQAKKEAKVRLEGKTYIVQDGDIINFHFNV